MQKLASAMPGLALVLAVSLSASLLNDLLAPAVQLEALTIAIVLGMLIANTVGVGDRLRPGIRFSLKDVLKAGIVLLGFKLDIGAVLALGPRVLAMVVVYVAAALTLAWLLGRWMGIDRKLAVLIGVGSSICGASAVVAMAPCVDAEDDDAVIAVSVVGFLGAIGVILYTAVAKSGCGIDPTRYGVWSGLTLHGVAHALAAAFAMGDHAGSVGTLVKMTRVLMLVPVSLVLTGCFHTRSAGGKAAGFPVYVLLFVAAGVINGLGVLPAAVAGVCVKAGSLFILMAMTAMGLSVHFRSVVRKGAAALGMGAALFLLLSAAGFAAVTNLI